MQLYNRYNVQADPLFREGLQRILVIEPTRTDACDKLYFLVDDTHIVNRHWKVLLLST